MYEIPRVALTRAVNEGKTIAAEILQLQLRVGARYISEDVAVAEYEVLLRRVEAVRGLAEQAQAAMLELSPPALGPLPEAMVLGLAELRTLSAELRRDPTSRKVSEEMTRISATQITPAAEAWYSQGTGVMGAVPDDTKNTKCLANLTAKRIMTLGPAGLGVSVAAIAMPVMD